MGLQIGSKMCHKGGLRIFCCPQERPWIMQAGFCRLTKVRGRQLGDGMGGGRNGHFWGAPIFGQNPEKYSIFPLKYAKSGCPKNSRSYHHPSHPPFDALLESISDLCVSLFVFVLLRCLVLGRGCDFGWGCVCVCVCACVGSS